MGYNKDFTVWYLSKGYSSTLQDASRVYKRKYPTLLGLSFREYFMIQIFGIKSKI